MRKILLYIVVLTINHMTAQENKNSLKDTIKFEKFDFNLWNTRYKDFEKDPKYGGVLQIKRWFFFPSYLWRKRVYLL